MKPILLVCWMLGVATSLAPGHVHAQAQSPWSSLGRTATAAEIRAWNIDVRPDFAGLPPGKGSVAQGQQVWDAKCASCHGTFGESNEVFTPIIGGTTAADVKTGHVAHLISGSEMQRSTMMKVASLSGLWDYINRAMPWNAPKSLSTDEVYGVTAYILNLADVVPSDFVLSQANMAATQNLLPNRNGMTRQHGLWSVKGKPDVIVAACMKDCMVATDKPETLPEHARNSHGNLALQNREFGPVRGADTTAPRLVAPLTTAPQPLKVASSSSSAVDPVTLASRNGCVVCHKANGKLVGPGWKDIAQRYAGRSNALAALTEKVRKGGQGNWGQIPMPPHPTMTEDELVRLVRWVLATP
jgi:cytochrome c